MYKRQLYNGFYYIRLIVHAAVHRVLDVIQIENICHNALQVYLAFSHCFNCQRIDVAVAEYGADGQLFVTDHAGVQVHGTGGAVANLYERTVLYQHFQALVCTCLLYTSRCV